jgi:preprotein translocase subunit SecE
LDIRRPDEGLTLVSAGGLHYTRPCPGMEAIMARTNPLQFIQQVRAETAKVVWPTRREVGLTTVMVLIMAALFATFFFLIDMLIRFSLETILNFST